MARVRRAGPSGDDVPPPPTRGPDSTALGELLRARRFRLSAGAERVAQNLARFGGEVAADAAPWIGSVRPPADVPSLSLGSRPGTLGPRSFGFLNNVGGIAALDAPLPALPRKGGLALVVPARDALPDLGPLALARGLGLSWVVSVGDGDPAEALAFLSADPATRAIAVVLGAGGSGATLRQVLGAKPTVVWGGDAVCRAVARRAGAVVVDGIDAWLARAALLDAGVEPGARVSVVVVGGGSVYVQGAVRDAGLAAEVVAVDERQPEALAAAVEAARAGGRPVVLVAGGPPQLPAPSEPVPAAETADDAPPLQLLQADLRHPEHLRALLDALAAPPLESDEGRGKPRVDKALLDRVRGEVEGALSDHDAKRLLKAYGVRVTRQAPTSTPTGAAKLAKTIGLPVMLVAGADARLAESPPEVRRLATLMLQEMTENRSVMVREHFAEVPRVRIRVVGEKGLGLTLRLEGVESTDACALLPLTRADATALAAATPARRAADQRAVADLLGRIAACAVAEDAVLELELFVGVEPAVLSASGTLRRR